VGQVKDSTKELLSLLLWTAGMFTRPTLRNLTDSYETWAYRNGFRRQIRHLQRQQFLEIEPPARAARAISERVLRLTDEGRLVALGGRDPELAWKRAWDEHWRFVVFDLPTIERRVRKRLIQSLRRRGYGWLQRSVWISPQAIPDDRELAVQTRANVKSLMVFENQPYTGERNQEMVAGAWDFAEINRRYARCLEILKACPKGRPRASRVDKFLREWIRRERQAWLAAVSVDPLLPESLLPDGYLGQEVWKRRVDSSRKTATLIQSFCRT
jgi:DNA-binding transcriptional regulator PaaX